ncbi:MAG: polysaccharide deacetylase family protein, partial [Acidimicrobiales bacterium]
VGGAAGALVGAAAFAHLVPGVVAWRQMRCRLAPGLAGVGRRDHVALTFDDGPDRASTPAVLDALDEAGWKATFFLLGEQVRRAPELAVELVERGHELGVHGDRHVSHLRRPASWATSDVRRARDLIADVTGISAITSGDPGGGVDGNRAGSGSGAAGQGRELRWFRPPYGALAASSLVAARRVGLRPVLWTTWGVDWRPDSTPASVADRVLSTFYPGATVLLHDSDVTSAPGAWRATVGALPRLAGVWADQGLTVGPLRDHGLD